MSILDQIVPFAALGVAVILVFGLANMMRGGSPNTSQKLMRLRVIAQFVTIVLVMGALYLRSQ
ncbi:MAG: twin transmembrane helix small protein [Hyphomicrobiales bacterium]|jgi:hypothetical protein|nr:twin transmembrane helix small protein [Hyphomicrobiales bacterium]NBS00704.1 twin transmembrane helix small protein [Hyphomicrobiales bacterium]